MKPMPIHEAYYYVRRQLLPRHYLVIKITTYKQLTYVLA